MSAADLALLQTARLKGRSTADELIERTGCSAEELTRFVERGDLREKNDRLRLTPEGKDRLAGLLAAERETLDQHRLTLIYERFTELNATFKELATSWQQKDGGPNDHADAVYDQAILDRLADEVHPALSALLGELAGLVARLAPYEGRFEAALTRIREGDHGFFLKPVVDSYHTVWFELHEELIGVTGRDRESEATAGRAE